MPVMILSHKKLSYKWLRFAVTGIEALDQQHQGLLDRMNALKEILTHGADPGETQARLLELRTLFEQHFADEDQRMMAWGFPGFAAHFKAHQAFLEGPLLQTITDVQGQEGYDLGALIDWEAGHISRFDRPMAEYLLANPETD
ncbi:MAG: hemerythrin domain-containing protein [Magnetococcales bacterium]|nr:hemerythrin domain-containing protein [Magnetococcales bacterium]